MDQTSQEEFDRIVKLDPNDLTSFDRDFLNARRDYLTNDQLRIFNSVLIKEEAPLYVSKKDRGEV